MLLDARRILHGGEPNAAHSTALECPTGFRIPFLRAALLLHLFLTSEPLWETAEETQEEPERQCPTERLQKRPRRAKKQQRGMDEAEPPQEVGRDYQSRYGRGSYLPFVERNREFVMIDTVIGCALTEICSMVVSVTEDALQPAGRAPMLSGYMRYTLQL
ncbi:hypothetical protein CDCA_CDCA11G3119 [Cyanidium caldarium]|uniref:Uncharacterized protein n=1 Tax=Cyanidium caldarium TaxID=2771 RepID=A0AAV9IYB3_CYACA|nr:hypothetical protein CDCA_CDCA11G3119 [Cyanidium caldarium]